MLDINRTDKADVLTIELAPVQREALDKTVELTGFDDETLAQAMFDYGFEAMDGLARLTKDK